MTTITNFYENLVFEKITEISNSRDLSLGYNSIQDIACIALNALPPRYIHHSIDAIFYIPDSEREQMDRDVENAVNDAINKVTSYPRD